MWDRTITGQDPREAMTYCSNTRCLARRDIEIPATIPHSRSHAKAPERALHLPFSTGLRL